MTSRDNPARIACLFGRGTRFPLRVAVFVAGLLLLGAPVWAQSGALGEQEAICQTLESAARANRLPIDFLTRVIWQESRFRPNVVGPVTRNGERAQGIAQFMPSTAAAYRLLEPFNPTDALPKSGEFLAELRDEFGNLGLAAAAYNAGPQRVREFIAGSRDLPTETRNYVLAITGRSVDDWVSARNAILHQVDQGDSLEGGAAVDCHAIVALLRHATGPSLTETRHRRVPSWCKHLYHPSISVCGTVHQEELEIIKASLVRPAHHLPISETSSH